MTSDPQQQENAFKQSLELAMRAIAQESKLTASYESRAPGLSGTTVYLPAMDGAVSPQKVRAMRGLADSLSLRFANHHNDIHDRYRPRGRNARLVFEAMEQARIEATGALVMPGMARNLTAMLEERYARCEETLSGDHEDTPLHEALALLVRERLIGAAPPANARPMVESWRPLLEDKAGKYLRCLTAQIADQAAFARTVRSIIARLGMTDELDRDPDERRENEGQDSSSGSGEAEHDEQGRASQKEVDCTGQDHECDGETVSQGEEGGAVAAAKDTDVGEREKSGDGNAPWRARLMTASLSNKSPYRVFTSEFDEEIKAEDLCGDAELTRLRAQLDRQIGNMPGVIARLANKLQRCLMTKQNRGWDFELEEGLLDTGRLPRIIIDLTHPLAFKRERDHDFRDTVVTLLLDNSGSMRGRPIGTAASCADILTRTLERCAVKVEILGFTTQGWKGGQSREKWLAAGKPAAPGRLNDLRHIIYKTADTPWRRARRNLGLTMREGLLKENIDGEALAWAHSRLAIRPERRRIMMVISDGAPVDDSTLSANAGNFLEEHLHQVIETIETRSSIELVAIGIGHDVTRYYRRAVTVSDVSDLGGVMTEKLIELFANANRVEPAWRARASGRNLTLA
ncbi:MAG: cobaltochelatase subunit CobT [Hyphomicrobiales bacterium]